MSNKLKLKPCPFCGSKVRWCGEHNENEEDNHDCHYIVCDNCNVQFVSNYIDSNKNEIMEELRKAAVEFWNMRFKT